MKSIPHVLILLMTGSSLWGDGVHSGNALLAPIPTRSAPASGGAVAGFLDNPSPRTLGLVAMLEQQTLTDPVELANWYKDQMKQDDPAALWFVLGNLQYQAGNWVAAESAYLRANDLFPDQPAILERLALVYLQQNQPRLAAGVFAQRIALGAVPAAVFRQYGYALAEAGKYIAAETALRQALLLDAENPESLRQLARVLAFQERFAEAVSLCRARLEDNPGDVEMVLLEARMLLMKGEGAKALPRLEPLHRLGALDATWLSTLGDLTLEDGRAEDALNIYKESWGGQPIPPKRALGVADRFLRHGTPELADAVLEMLPNSVFEEGAAEERAQALFVKASTRLALKDDANASRLLDQALALDPTNGHMLLKRAEMALQKGEVDAALVDVARARQDETVAYARLLLQARAEALQEAWGAAFEAARAAQALQPSEALASYVEGLRRRMKMLAEHP